MDHEKKLTIAARKLLKGRVIKDVRYLNAEEQEDHGWMRRPLVIELDDGTFIYPSRDDEGNDAGALFTTHDDLPVIGVL